jgi:tight adherence protein C
MTSTFTLVTFGGGFLAAVGVFLAVFALRPAGRSDSDLVTERLDAYQVSGEVPQEDLINLDDEEARLPFHKRVLLPVLRRMGAAMVRNRPDAARIDLQRKLNLAGRPLGLSAGDYLAVRYVAAGLGGVACGLLGLFGGPMFAIVGLGIGAMLGLMAPRYLLASRIKKAHKEIQQSLPDAMDLMSVCVEAGLTFEGAMGKVAERYENTLGQEFTQVLREIRLGRARREAMSDLGDRSGVDEMFSFCQAIIQSDTLGTGITRILRIQSDELRRRRRQRAQEQGAKAGLKMLFPMVAFIFPALWIVLLGPAGLLLLQEFSSH